MTHKRTRLFTMVGIFLGLTLVLCGFASCDLMEGVRNYGSGTPAVMPAATAPASQRGTTYAYVSKNQIWTVLSGGKPRQVSHFDTGDTPDIYWHIPAWSQDDRYLAIIVNAQPTTEGGGGCPGTPFGMEGVLYVFDMVSQLMTQVSLPADKTPVSAKIPQNGYWQSLFWQDTTHLLAWYNGPKTASDTTAGLYSYDMASGKLTQTLTASALGVTPLFNQRASASTPLLLSMRYSQNTLYYQQVTQPFSANSQLLIKSVALDQKGAAPKTVLDQGHESWCKNMSAVYSLPGWDVSPDGQRALAQKVDQQKSTIEMLSMGSGQVFTIFQALPAAVLSHDLVMSWNSTGEAMAVSEVHAFDQNGPFSMLLAQPDKMTSYTPASAGQISWRPDGGAFTLQDPDLASATEAPPGPYNYQVNQQGQSGQATLLLSGARNFTWG